jgi:hypothetical protein
VVVITKVSEKKVARSQDELKGVRASTLKGCCARLFQGPQDFTLTSWSPTWIVLPRSLAAPPVAGASLDLGFVRFG